MSGPFSHDAFDARRLGLEEDYFRHREATLVEKLKSVFNAAVTKEELRSATGITNEELLDRLVATNLRGEMLTAFKLYPLVEIAWADGKVDDHEARAIVEAAVKSGVREDGPGMERLRDWIRRGPNEDARKVWRLYAGELTRKLTKDELAVFRKDLLGYAKHVAEASGGILGLVFNISPSEQRVIDELTKHLS